jgi:hypothetical protein
LFRSAPTSYPSSRARSSSYCSVLRPAVVLLGIFQSLVYIFRSPVYIFRSPVYIFQSSVYILRFPVYIFRFSVYYFVSSFRISVPRRPVTTLDSSQLVLGCRFQFFVSARVRSFPHCFIPQIRAVSRKVLVFLRPGLDYRSILATGLFCCSRLRVLLFQVESRVCH